MRNEPKNDENNYFIFFLLTPVYSFVFCCTCRKQAGAGDNYKSCSNRDKGESTQLNERQILLNHFRQDFINIDLNKTS